MYTRHATASVAPHCSYMSSITPTTELVFVGGWWERGWGSCTCALGMQLQVSRPTAIACLPSRTQLDICFVRMRWERAGAVARVH